ncbi:holin, Cph1 family [Alkalithermobacter thermoalcaliphilus JW-YL-7 = DSM 7308]|uniref:Holin, Cph1 family n=1 Tax=Alkalithermobacter thermoalcaliphilus JW-YL-7 = DSM 7308 TaxID=1121328 RepID=A0A150FQZ1_CLOPD|nr:toxin secretion/phage lysis holin [[Clostridium] paradoxum JW-YL-7 = DSM 7308]SHL13992.1 holin, Cph1 family [[Clostridium] paradoxum JW-YL-7 = DSM 7308]
MDKKDIINAITSGVGSILTYLIGRWDTTVQILAILMICDYVTGIMKAYRQQELSSSIGFKGLNKKIAIFIALILAHQLDLVSGMEVPLFRTATTYFYISNEGISICENLDSLGLPLPDFIRNTLLKVKEKNNKINKEEIL